ncbi:HAMP domain-containing histidine kinase [Billgrantia diversa]|uniref:ATP-binding protein n=1 Tax=Halomonas sp. MCCC 1A13316 TaxID=2733487 RepID=UPI0018A6674E|nr:HAMP domain-containing sensor histidine kinase [Halomonas sp. MCCC 1A13316]QOR38047.1 HAMP domain-containing histidine kinase [Halomonas sp. MCCC 1A13316]
MNRLRRLSLASRLILATLLVLAITLPLAGLGLAQHFRTTATGAFDRQLEALLNVVIAGLAWGNVEQRLVQERNLGDPRFEQVFSGWYWQVSDGADRVLTSRSLWDQRLPVRESAGVVRHDMEGPRGAPLRVVERDILLAPLEAPLHVSVAAPREPLDLELDRFARLVALSLAGLGLLVLIMLALQVRWGLAPLRRMQGNLAQVENGDAERLDTRLPAELARLAGATNAVLARDRRLMEHARRAAGNLAHALKTPVSVLTTLADGIEEPRRSKMRDELGRIDDAVRHHLARATAAGDVGLAPKVAVAEVLAPILDGLGRLAGRRGVTLEHSLPDGLRVRMAPQDLQELVGNLMDNALRWANGHVRLEGHSGDDGIWLCVEDDGPGMDETQRGAAMARGSRLDERRSGSGLGLAIVADLVTLHGGRLQLDASPLGGLSALVWLPVRPLAEVPAMLD